MTYDSSGQDEDSNDEYNDHENIVESSNSTIKIPHRRLETESFSVDTENGGLDLISRGISVTVFVEHLESNLSSLKIRETDHKQMLTEVVCKWLTI